MGLLTVFEKPTIPEIQKYLAYLESLPNIQVTIKGEPYFTREVLADRNFIINTGNQTVDRVIPSVDCFKGFWLGRSGKLDSKIFRRERFDFVKI